LYGNWHLISNYTQTLDGSNHTLVRFSTSILLLIDPSAVGQNRRLWWFTILKELERQTGQFHTDRINVAIRPDTKEALLAKLGSGLEWIGKFKVEKFITTDGFKYLLPNDEWVAFRASGTEPLIRCYLEAKTPANLRKLRQACKGLLQV
jgi:phosphomannomutase